VFVAGAWAFLPGPALFWVAAIFLASLVFYGFRRLAESLVGAIAAHAGFNLAMNWIIFYAIIPIDRALEGFWLAGPTVPEAVLR
jgi:uncharacterized protein